MCIVHNSYVQYIRFSWRRSKTDYTSTCQYGTRAPDWWGAQAPAAGCSPFKQSAGDGGSWPASLGRGWLWLAPDVGGCSTRPRRAAVEAHARPSMPSCACYTYLPTTLYCVHTRINMCAVNTKLQHMTGNLYGKFMYSTLQWFSILKLVLVSVISCDTRKG